VPEHVRSAIKHASQEYSNLRDTISLHLLFVNGHTAKLELPCIDGRLNCTNMEDVLKSFQAHCLMVYDL
jgi:hypothetical protein